MLENLHDLDNNVKIDTATYNNNFMFMFLYEYDQQIATITKKLWLVLYIQA